MHWEGLSLQQAVLRGNQLEHSTGQVFTWPTSTNEGAADVCKSALILEGIDEEEFTIIAYHHHCLK